jgi:hypothetical protein
LRRSIAPDERRNGATLLTATIMSNRPFTVKVNSQSFRCKSWETDWRTEEKARETYEYKKAHYETMASNYAELEIPFKIELSIINLDTTKTITSVIIENKIVPV